MSRKRKAVVVILGVLLLFIFLNIILNTVFCSVEVIINEARGYSYGGHSTYTLYFNRLLVEARVHRLAEKNWFIRLFRLPEQIKVISKEDSNSVLQLKRELKNKESELSYDDARSYPYVVVMAKGTRHYVVLYLGTPEAVEINRIFYTYMYGRANW